MYQQAVQAAQCHQPTTVGVGDGGSGSQTQHSGNGGPVFLPLFMNPQTNPSMQYLSGKCFPSYLETELFCRDFTFLLKASSNSQTL